MSASIYSLSSNQYSLKLNFPMTRDNNDVIIEFKYSFFSFHDKKTPFRCFLVNGTLEIGLGLRLDLRLS